MEIAKIYVNGVRGLVLYRAPMPAGIVGATVRIECSELWDGLHKTVVFKGAQARDILNAGDVVTIPPEVVAKPGYRLQVGVYGFNDEGTIVIPTLWADLGIVRDAADPELDKFADSALPVWAQLQVMIGDLEELSTEAKNSLVAAVNELAKRSGGDVDPEEIQQIVEEYLKENSPASGADGKDGITPHIGDNGNWFIGDIDTGKPSRGEVGPQGEQGETGAIGPAGAIGATPNIQIGEVTTLEAGSEATASITGTAENPLLNLGIPRGADGEGGGENSGISGYERLIDFTTEEDVTEFSTPTIDSQIAEKIKTAREVIVEVYVPRDSADTETSTLGTVTVSVRGSWLWHLVSVDIIPAPTETWTKYGQLYVRSFFPESLEEAAYQFNTSRIVGRSNSTKFELKPFSADADYRNMKPNVSYFKVAGSQSMAAGTRLVVGVRK